MAIEGAAGRRVAAISDLHGFLPAIPPCDLLLIAGDLCPASSHKPEYQRTFLQGPFSDWLKELDAGEIVGVAGNHDFLAEADPDLMRALPWTYLCDETTTAAGFLVHGSPFTPKFFNWAFMESDAELARRWSMIPDDVEVLVVHGPPFGIGDETLSGIQAGSKTLLERLPVLSRLRLNVFGHIHEAGGTDVWLANARLVNVSHVDFDFNPVRGAAVFEL